MVSFVLDLFAGFAFALRPLAFIDDSTARRFEASGSDLVSSALVLQRFTQCRDPGWKSCSKRSASSSAWARMLAAL
ncbi:hypothetical protein DXT66_25825 [Nocardia farcinica]|nr:hypothetical protein DXT66_25825 [Nocardia farcinica]